MPKHQSTAAKRARTAARDGEKYTVALRTAEESPTPPPAAFRSNGEPAVSVWTGDPHNDVNPACGHHLKLLCGGCAVCTACDGCYCAEAAEEAALDAETARAYDEHIEHDEFDADCYLCEYEREESNDFTGCLKCGLPYRDGRGDHQHHQPPYCRPLPRFPLGTDWSYLLGQEVTLVGRDYSIHGLVLPEQDVPDPADYAPLMWLRRTDPGYEDGPDERSPFFPREWLEVHPAPPANA
ncbi:hypothetical protein ACFC8F_23175 [Streptomyces hydrogenans]|uniref:hypothetical protein n=1 Tax=Streptomyces hydrogenans TaxID=1873719 RepID=UPI0035DAA462